MDNSVLYHCMSWYLNTKSLIGLTIFFIYNQKVKELVEDMQFHASIKEYPDTIIGKVVEVDGLIVEGKTKNEVLKQLEIGIEEYFKAFPEEIETIKQKKLQHIEVPIPV